jgi:hypothetical protein
VRAPQEIVLLLASVYGAQPDAARLQDLVSTLEGMEGLSECDFSLAFATRASVALNAGAGGQWPTVDAGQLRQAIAAAVADIRLGDVSVDVRAAAGAANGTADDGDGQKRRLLSSGESNSTITRVAVRASCRADTTYSRLQ